MLLDNKKNGRVGDKIKENLSTNSRVSIISSLFSIYGFEELKQALLKIDSARFLFSDPPITIDGEPSGLFRGLNGQKATRIKPKPLSYP